MDERVTILRCTHLIHNKCLLIHLAVNDNYLCIECEDEIINKQDLNDYLNKKDEVRVLKSDKILDYELVNNDSQSNSKL